MVLGQFGGVGGGHFGGIWRVGFGWIWDVVQLKWVKSGGSI